MGVLKGEPSLEEILSEPIVHLLMAADRVSLDDLRALYAHLAQRMSDPGGARVQDFPAAIDPSVPG